MITLNRLSDCAFQDAVSAWNKGFSRYYMNIQMTIESFLNLIKSEGVSTDLSILAYHGNEPIGIVLNGIREINGSSIAWNGGTCVAPEFRGKGVGKLMMRETINIYKQNNVDVATLEAVTQNAKAIRLYQKMGYEIIDHLLTYISSESSFQPNPLIGDFSKYNIIKVRPKEIQYVPFYNNRVPWQTQWQSVNSGEGLLVLDRSGEYIGYALYRKINNHHGSHVSTTLYQCETLQHRNDQQAIAAHLLSQCFSPLDKRIPRMAINLSDTNHVVISLLNQAGFRKEIEHVYMEKAF